jgi:hypothetical protein
MAANEATSGRRVALSTAIAGLVGTLAGTVVGGLISLAAVQQNIRAEEASNLRANRQQAYSVFLADVNRHINFISASLADNNNLDSAEKAELDDSGLGLARTYAAVALMASEAVNGTLSELEDAANEFENAARSEGDTETTSGRLATALDAFLAAAREDLGAAG